MVHALAKGWGGSGKLPYFFRVALLLLLFLLIPARAERLPIKTYTTDDGLIRNLIRQILQDSHGYLWLVTPTGLSRFDGYSFRNYGVEQDLYASSFWQMIEDRNGGYWVATTGSGLYRFKPEVVTREAASRFERYRLGASPQSDFIYALCQDRTGKVWAGGGDGLFCLDEGGGETAFRQVEIAAQGNGPVTISGMREDREGSLWISSVAGLYRRLPEGRMVRYIFPPQDKREVGHLFFDRDGRLWVEHGGGLVVLMPEPAAAITGDVTIRFSSQNGRATKKEGDFLWLPDSPGAARKFGQDDGFAGDDVTSMCQTYDGKIWLGIYQKGLLLFDGRGFRLYAKEQGLSYYKVRSLAEDSEGNLWIGTDGGGLMKKIKGGFTAFSESDGIDETSIVFMLEDQSGGVCVATDLGGVGRFDGERFKPVKGQASDRLVKSVASDNARFYYANPVLKDRAGETWFSTGEGLYRFPRVQRFEQLAATPPKAVYTVADGLPGNNIYRTFEDSRGDIWVSVPDARGGILSRWDRATGSFHNFGKDNGLVSSEGVTAICEDMRGDIWLGFGSRVSRGGVVARYRGGRFTYFSKDDGVPEGMVRDLFLDTAGRLWIASGKGGLARVDDPAAERPTFFKYTVENGLADNETNCLAEDQWQNIYVGMGRGLDRIDPATGRIRHYTGADGLTSTDVRKIIQDSGNSFWIATAKGLYRFVPEQESHRPPPRVLITGIHIAGSQYPISELGARHIRELELEAGQNNLQIDFVSPSLGFAGTIRYECMLEGANQEWQSTGQRSIYYPGLPAGSYRFLVRAVGDDGSVSETPAWVSFTILRPIWQRWWFICLAFILAAIPALLVARYRRARIRAEQEAEIALQRSREERLAELERVRRHIATDLHDDIGSSLTRISLLSEVAQRKLDGTDALVKEPLTLIARLSRELVDSMSEIVWAINPSKDHLSDLSQRMRHFASDLFTARQIDFRFHSPELDHDIKVGANVRREVFLVFKEAVNNTVRHSACTRAEIVFRSEGDRLILILSDNGKGFDTVETGNGHGLQSMRERTGRLGGSFEIDSGPGRGTTIRFAVPVRAYEQNQIQNN